MPTKTFASRRGASNYSRSAAGFFNSRAWLDKPLPVARTIGRHLLAAVEPALARIYWASLSAKSTLEDERANREAQP